MYSQVNSVPTDISVSASLDGLAQLKQNNVNYLAIHDSEKVSVVSIGPTAASNKEITFEVASEDNRNFIQMAKLILVHEKVLLVVASSKTVRIYLEEENFKLIFSHNLAADHKLGQIVHSIECLNQESKYIKSTPNVATLTHVVAVGTQSKLHFFVSGNATSFKLKDVQQDFRSSSRSMIHSFASNGLSQCAVAENTGLITVWKLEDSSKPVFTKVTSVEVHPNTKTTGLKLFANLIVLSTISGQIQLISLASGQLLCEIQAHVKCITSFDIANKSGYLATVSEDSHMRIFRLESNAGSKCKVEFLHQVIIENALISGVKFLDSKGDELALCIYESSHIRMFKQTQ